MARLQTRTVQIHQNGIGLHPLLDFTGIDAECLRPVDRSPAEHLLCLKQRRIALYLGQQRCKFHFSEEVKAVVGGRPVRAKGNPAPGIQSQFVREAPAAQFHIGTWTMRDRHSPARQNPPFLLIHIYTMGGYHIRTEESYLIQIPHRGDPVFLHAIFNLLTRFRKVDMELEPVPAGKFGSLPEFGRTYRIYGVGSHHELNPTARRVRPVHYKIFLPGFHGLAVIFHDRNSDCRPHSGSVHHRYRLFYVKIHIRKEGGAG